MGIELLRVFAGRPVTVMEDGWVVMVAVRDSGYMTTLKAYKRLLRDAHPDKHPQGEKKKWAGKFRRIHGERAVWRNQEAQWYARHGLLPPDGYEQAQGRRERFLRLKGKGRGECQSVQGK